MKLETEARIMSFAWVLGSAFLADAYGWQTGVGVGLLVLALILAIVTPKKNKGKVAN